MSTEPLTVYCPLGDCRSVIELERGEGVYYFKAFTDDPEVPLGYRTPEPNDRVGGDMIVDAGNKRQEMVQCTNSHYLELHIGTTDHLGPDDFVVGPADTTDRIRCPDCGYRFVDTEEGYTTPERDETHRLVGISRECPTEYSEVETVTERTLANDPRIAVRQSCPYCGEYLSFNYRLGGDV